MNRFDGTLENGGIRAGGALLRPSDQQLHAAQGHGKLVVGIRPEHLSIGEGHLDVQIDLVEDLGSDFYVYGHRAEDTRATIIVRAGREHPRPGEAIKVKIDTSRMHLFDAGTGLRIGE
jgi:multiple sugar transport system ATP-binding protein